MAAKITFLLDFTNVFNNKKMIAF